MMINDFEFEPEIVEDELTLPTFDELEQLAQSGSISMLTRSGSINLLDPNPDDIVITDIAHALTYHVARWLNVGEGFYPVARHCLRCVEVARREYSIRDPYQLMALLMHDASEAYMCDVVRHVKKELPDYQHLEMVLMNAISDRFNFPWPMNPLLHQVDMMVQRHEYETNIRNRIKSTFDLDKVYQDFMDEFTELEGVINE
jgi:5'-deoxynucleotidase YfbR-like HD superfamily hydrolase